MSGLSKSKGPVNQTAISKRSSAPGIKVLRAVRSLSARGYTVLMSSHFPNHAFLASSRVLLLRDGALLADGPPEEVITGEQLTDLYQASVRVVAATERGLEDKEIRVCVPVLG